MFSVRRRYLGVVDLFEQVFDVVGYDVDDVFLFSFLRR